jgi:hypothetical protein
VILKKKMIKRDKDSKFFRIKTNLEDEITMRWLSWIRFVCFDEDVTLL